ncbi:MAG TPA: uroporphyrinogen-III synthase, partial [Rhodocyclaceae bacterium]|nr:uroporphyrinogen-III synthase [Rhodocyclaceae bacterium]
MNRTDAAYPLSGNTIVITRPVRQSEALKQALTARGAQVLLFPVIDIAPLNDSTDLRDLASRLADYHIAFFVSPNAVDYAFTVLGNVTWPMHLEVAAM